MREPLLGWGGTGHGREGLRAGRLFLMATAGGAWTVEADTFIGDAADQPLRAAKLAAEDAARAMVADMAMALGGSVTWADGPKGGE